MYILYSQVWWSQKRFDMKMLSSNYFLQLEKTKKVLRKADSYLMITR